MRRILPAALLALAFAFMATLYVTGQRSIYDNLLRFWGVDPFTFPFLDVETVLSAVRCLKDGVDVFAHNPCDPLRRVFDYSPLWLLLAKLPVTHAWTNPAGLVVDLAFIGSLVLLPAGRTRAATGLIALAALSSAVVFALERGNNDLVLLTLAIVAAALACKSPAWRVAGYAAALLAGLLKYYPMTLMVLTLRERPARFVVVLAGVLAVVALFLITMGHDLMRALHLIPRGGWYGDMFGSSTFPGGLARLMGWPDAAASALHVGLAAAAFSIGGFLGVRPFVATALDRLTELERTTLLAGALLILACFFTAQNIGYRAAHVVLTVPALTALWHLRAGRAWTVTMCAALALLWAQGWRNWIPIVGRPAMLAGWFVREALWWWTITVLIAVVTSLILRSEMGQRLTSRRSAPSQSV
jgi:hypothetical protein